MYPQLASVEQKERNQGQNLFCFVEIDWKFEGEISHPSSDIAPSAAIDWQTLIHLMGVWVSWWLFRELEPMPMQGRENRQKISSNRDANPHAKIKKEILQFYVMLASPRKPLMSTEQL